MDTPLAYLITFRTYGTWLHGDARGSFDRTRRAFGQELIPESANWQRYERGLLRARRVLLDDAGRRCVGAAVRETCLAREWPLSALNVRTNHVHVVLTAVQPPEYVMQRLKADATRELRRAGIIAPGLPIWSRHGSTRYLWAEDDVGRACHYVLDAQ